MNTKALAVAASLWVPMVATAATEASVTDQQEALSARLEQILSKNGIAFGGQFRGEIGASILGGNSQTTARRDDEQIGFTSVDFDLRARPNTYTTARAVFRMHLDYANFFGSPYAPFETRWLSLDGTAADMLYYHMGSITQKWSPLTIGSTIPGFMYTPRIFAQQQQQAMGERFITDGRNLQGVNLGLRAAVPAIQIDSFDVALLAAKLLSAGPWGYPATPFVTGKSPSGDGTVGYPDSLANFDRWALGGKANIAFFKGLSVGFNFLNTQDLKSTYGTTDTSKKIERLHVIRLDSVAAGAVVRTTVKDSFVLPVTTKSSPEVQRDTIWQNGTVLSANFGADVAKVLGNNNLIAQVSVDFANSSWDRYATPDLSQASTAKLDSVAAGTGKFKVFFRDTGYFVPVYVKKTGVALNASVAGGWKTETWTAKARAGFISNDSSFRSDLAQTAVFDRRFGRIFNSEQDLTGGFSHYNTFDAMYHNVHRWVAEEANEYAKNPYDKLAYSNYVAGMINPSLGNWSAKVRAAYKPFKADQDSLNATSARWAGETGAARITDSANVSALKATVADDKASLYSQALDGMVWDRDLQLVLPAGEASANRVGPKFGLDFDLMQGGVEVKLDGYMLQEAKGTILDSLSQLAADKAKFQQIQAGTRVRVDRFINGWNMPIELTGSFGLSTAKGGTSLDYTSTAINAGLYAGVIKRLSVLAGYQMITGKDKAFLVDRNQSNMAGGLEFKVQEGAYLLAMYNLITTEFPNASEYNFDQSIWSTKISVSF